jgi:hypothetical protein
MVTSPHPNTPPRRGQCVAVRHARLGRPEPDAARVTAPRNTPEPRPSAAHARGHPELHLQTRYRLHSTLPLLYSLPRANPTPYRTKRDTSRSRLLYDARPFPAPLSASDLLIPIHTTLKLLSETFPVCPMTPKLYLRLVYFTLLLYQTNCAASADLRMADWASPGNRPCRWNHMGPEKYS